MADTSRLSAGVPEHPYCAFEHLNAPAAKSLASGTDCSPAGALSGQIIRETRHLGQLTVTRQSRSWQARSVMR